MRKSQASSGRRYRWWGGLWPEVRGPTRRGQRRRFASQPEGLNANAGNYFAPNRIIPKRERPKWRFVARRLYKELLQAENFPEVLGEAAGALEDLYKVLCHSCAWVLFNAYDTFESVGISQPDFFQGVLRLKMKTEVPGQFVRGAVRLVVEQPLNRYALYEDRMDIAIGFLRTPDLKQIAISACDQLRAEYDKPAPTKDKRKPGNWSEPSDYARRERRNNLAVMGFLCHAALCEYDQAV